MSGAQQTCPLCSWYRWQDVPDQLVGEARDELLTHVARSLQWEWQAHVERDHGKQVAYEYAALTLDAFDHWVAQESQQPIVEEIPPSEGVGKTVRANPTTITPDQAKQLAEAVEHTLASVAESIQRFAEHAVPAIHAAQETLTKGLRQLVDAQGGPVTPLGACDCGGPGSSFYHRLGDRGCLFTPVGLRQQGPFMIPKPAVHVPRNMTDGVPGDRPYGTVDAEICSNCQRLAGEPHGLPSCAEPT